jgi:hypothetical protein
MAARRDRERRRPAAERRYRFGTPEAAPAVDSDSTSGIADEAPIEAAETPRTRSRTGVPEVASTTRGGARVAGKPFSAFAAEYTYVLGDLRRVALVIGSLLVILLLLYFVLPR